MKTLPPWTLSVICLIAIFWLTLAPHPLGDNDIPLFPGADKIVHALMFGGLTFCIIIDWLRRRDWPAGYRRIYVSAPLFASAIGVITEILQQSMHIGRSGDPIDLLADISGAFVMAVLFIVFQYFRKNNRTS